jgi:hypothetical protein
MSSSMSQRSVRSTCDRGSYTTFVKISHRMGYLELLCTLEGTLSCWSWLHLQLLAPTPVSRRVDVRRPVVKIITESLSQHDEKNVVPTPLSGIREKWKTHSPRNKNSKKFIQFMLYKRLVNRFLYFFVTAIRKSRICIHTYIPLTLYPRTGSRGISDIPPRHPRFTKNLLAMRNTADVIGGKPIVVLLQSISDVSAINPLVAFYDIHGGKK